MSKIDDVRKKSLGLGMGLGEDGPESGEAAMLQDRLSLLNKQEFLRAKSTAEVISRLECLQREIKSASENVRASAHEVRGYPSEVVTQLSTRVEVCFARCEDAAKRAVEVFAKTEVLQLRLDRSYMILLFTASLGVGIVMPLLFIHLPKLFQ